VPKGKGDSLMLLNPNSHLFEEYDFILLRVLKKRECTADEISCVLSIAEGTGARTKVSIMQRIRFLIVMDTVVVAGMDLIEHKPVYRITEAGSRFIDTIDRLRDNPKSNPQARVGVSGRLAGIPITPYGVCTCGAAIQSPVEMSCLQCHRKANDVTFLWAVGIRVDDDLFEILGIPVKECEEQNNAR
jgi:hypothetical protein